MIRFLHDLSLASPVYPRGLWRDVVPCIIRNMGELESRSYSTVPGICTPHNLQLYSLLQVVLCRCRRCSRCSSVEILACETLADDRGAKHGTATHFDGASQDLRFLIAFSTYSNAAQIRWHRANHRTTAEAKLFL
jgi:hypothetical protein